MTKNTHTILNEKTVKMDKDKLEAMLAEQFGDKLQPVKEKLHKKLKKQPDYTEQSEAKARQRFGARLELEHLRADRMRQLLSEGKTKSQIRVMYHCSDVKLFNSHLKAIGCPDLVIKQKKAQ